MIIPGGFVVEEKQVLIFFKNHNKFIKIIKDFLTLTDTIIIREIREKTVDLTRKTFSGWNIVKLKRLASRILNF